MIRICDSNLLIKSGFMIRIKTMPGGPRMDRHSKITILDLNSGF